MKIAKKKTIRPLAISIRQSKGEVLSQRQPPLPVLLVLPPGRKRAQWARPLASAGWKVEACSAEIFSDTLLHQTARGKRKTQRDENPARHPLLRLKDWRSVILTSLRIGAGLAPAVRASVVLVADPKREGFVRLVAAGRQTRGMPAFFSESEYPILRLVIEQKKALYVPDGSVLSQKALVGSRNEGCMFIPLPSWEPMGVLCLMHSGGDVLEESAYAAISLITHGLEVVFENAALQRRFTAAELRYRSILTAAPFLIAFLDSDGTVLEINPQLALELKRQGIRPRRVVGINALQNRVLPRELQSLLETSLLTGQGFTREEVSLTMPRGPELLRLHVVPLGSGDSASELLVIAELITHYHQLMDEAERNERLAAIGRVAASLAHEVNNPLQALRSHLELIRSYPLSDEEREQSFLILEKEVERLDETTRRMLGFARPAPDILQPISILGVLDQAFALSRNFLQNQQIIIHTEYPEELPPVMAAPGQLIQVFLNIILNAAHAMRGCGSLDVRAKSLGAAVEVVFTNDGPPIPTEHLPRIFEPFYTTHPEGTGLGLSISHAILRRHHGTIRADNLTPKHGVAFTITLPFA
jgi:signal transduction histidine kinase